MRILVTGAGGRLGGKLAQTLNQQHDVVAVDVNDLDITDFPAVRQYVTRCAPDLVIHPAAWTDVDGCARDPERAIQVNGLGAQYVALAAAAAGAAVLYISSNEVFDGTADRPYYEYDTPNPANPYGYSKWVGERAVAHNNPRHYIVRTSWLFAHGGKNFIHTILNAAASGKRLRVVTDEIANPTYNDDLAAALAVLINTECYGVYHLVNEGACSRYDFARYFMDKAGYAAVEIEPILTRDWPRASVPPARTSLHNLAGSSLGIRLRTWQQAVDAFLAQEGLLVSKSL